MDTTHVSGHLEAGAGIYVDGCRSSPHVTQGRRRATLAPDEAFGMLDNETRMEMGFETVVEYHHFEPTT